jgi:hypothetical protein
MALKIVWIPQAEKGLDKVIDYLVSARKRQILRYACIENSHLP